MAGIRPADGSGLHLRPHGPPAELRDGPITCPTNAGQEEKGPQSCGPFSNYLRRPSFAISDR